MRTGKRCWRMVLKPSGLSYSQFAERGYLKGPERFQKYLSGGFKTPTGKAELYLSQAEKFGLSPLPQFTGFPDEEDPNYPLVLTSCKSRFYLHSSYRWVESLRKHRPHPKTEIHPETAARHGISRRQRDRDRDQSRVHHSGGSRHGPDSSTGRQRSLWMVVPGSRSGVPLRLGEIQFQYSDHHGETGKSVRYAQPQGNWVQNQKEIKSEARNSKFETNSKFKIQMSQTRCDPLRTIARICFKFGSLVF